MSAAKPTEGANLSAADFGEFGAQLILPLYYQQVRGESALTTGLLLAPQASNAGASQ